MIPKQLQNNIFRFIKIKTKEKVPVEKEWQKDNNYKWNDEELQNWIKDGGNYGIINASGNLLIIDADSPKITELVTQRLPKTFVVQTSKPGKNHFYYSCKNMTKSKLYLKDGMGDIRFSNSSFYTLCPGSIHPNGESYNVIIDSEIIEIEEKTVIEVLSEYIEEKKQKVKHTLETIEPGERNDTLFKFACKLKHDKYSYEDAFTLIKERNNRCKNPLSEVEVLTCLNSAYSYENEEEEKPKKEEKKTVKEVVRIDKEGLELLKDEDLLYIIVRELRKDVIGNIDMILALINKVCLRLVINANPASSNVLVSDFSGSGKDYITKNICNLLVPTSKYEHLSDVSEKLFNYWTIKEKDGGTFDGMVVHLEDISEERIKSQAFKVRASGENEIRIVDKGKVRNIIIVGKPVLIITSLKASIDIEGIRRWDKLNVDITDEITKRVKDIFARKMLGDKKYEHDDRIKYALHNQLCRVNVIIPYADRLCSELPNVLTMRTQMQKFFDYIKSSAALHQYQREKDKDGNIIANEFDYAYGKFCFTALQDVLGMASNTYEDEIVKVLKESGEYGLKVSEIASKTSLSKVTLYGQRGELGYLDNMKEKGMLSEYTVYDQDSRKDVTYWTLSTTYKNVLLKLYKDGKHIKTHEQVEKETQKTKFSKKLTTKVERKIDEVTPVVDAEKFIPESWLLTFLRLYARMSSYDIEKHGNLHK